MTDTTLVLAALDGEHLHLQGETRPRPWPVPDYSWAADWLDWMTGSVDVLYVHASALERMGLPAELPVPLPGQRAPAHPWLEAGRLDRRALAPSITNSDGTELIIGAYQDGAGDPFGELRDGRELLYGVLAFRDAFQSTEHPHGWTFKHSAAGTGWRLMHAPWNYGRRRVNLADGLDEPEPDWRQHAGAGGSEAPGQVEIPYGSKWAREPVPHDGWLRDHVHAYDVNGQRLAACSRLQLGVGGKVTRHRGQGTVRELINKGAAGYVQVRSVLDPYPGLIPPIFDPGWHTTPRVRMALQLGIPLVLGDAVIWDRSIPYLDPFYATMRDARNWLMKLPLAAPRAAALSALKQAYLQPFGRLRSARSAQRGDKLYRPSWYDQVIGRELALEYLRLHQLAVESADVLAVYFDAIIIESDTADITDAAPAPLACSDQLGKFKPVGTLTTKHAHQLLYRTDGSTDHNALMRAIKDRRNT